MTTVLCWWLLAFGVWPFARPDHDLTTPLGVVDLAIHAVAGTILFGRVLSKALDRTL
jgi:hypothetical protein